MNLSSSSNSTETTDFNPISFEVRKAWALSLFSEFFDSANEINILDFGCGNGLFTSELCRLGHPTWGVDVDDEQVNFARRRCPDATIFQADALSIKSTTDERFDAIFSLEVLEHLYDPEGYLRCARDLLRPGGKLFLTTPYYGYTKNVMLSLLDRWDHHLMPEKLHGHIKLFSKATLMELCGLAGFRVLRYQRLGRVPALAMMHGVVLQK